LGAETLSETLDALKAGRLSPTPQDPSQATLAPMLKKEDGRINWQQRAAAIHALVRGLDPWPGAWTEYEGQTWRIWRVDAKPEGGQAGVVLRLDPTGILVGATEGSVLITELQAPGKRRLTAREYLAGHDIKPGVRLG
jgi:methionyl-tRNA formyltransferase